MNTNDQRYMKRALELAKLGLGHVSPNPMVGCVIVHENKIIGEGWHQKYGGPHAEVNAIDSVEDKNLLPHSTAYVTLEPCAHHGKTPPCADLLVRYKLARVVIANKDPFPLVNGGGIKKLEDAGIDVEIGMLKNEGEDINKRFFTFLGKKRPYIILKWAQTSDGFIARENYDSKWISNEHSRKLVHKWRFDEDAILVGTNTARYDNPSLTVRDWRGSNPLRLFIDKNLQLDPSLNLFDQSTPTVCYNLLNSENIQNLEYAKISEGDVIRDILADLYKRKIQSLIVEGGSTLLNSFIEADLWDEARVFTSQEKFGKGILSPHIPYTPIEVSEIHRDSLQFFRK